MTEPSRQRRWQLRKEAEGRCVICSALRFEGATRCERHLEEARLRARRLRGSPVDAPLRRTGKPRKYSLTIPKTPDNSDTTNQ